MAGAARNIERTAEAAIRQPSHVLRAQKGVVNMPSRAIAAALLRANNKAMRHKDLYEKSREYGFINSRNHFKHVLKMMKGMKRICINCLHPEEIGGSKRVYTVNFTERGEHAYREVFGDNIPLPERQDQQQDQEQKESGANEQQSTRGLTDAL